ncbi:MAG: IPExxxVDY family protein [Bacteroidia bacterium]
MKKVKFPEPEPGFILLGVVSSERDYRLCFQINKTGLLHLSKTDAIKIPVADECIMTFNRFGPTTDEGAENAVYLVNNRQEGHLLFPNFKNLDYVLVINGPGKKEKAAELKAGLTSIPSIQAIFALEVDKLKSKNYLYLD